MGTVGLFVASICFGIAAVRTRRALGAGASTVSAWKPVVLGVLAVGLFFAAGEEISWGQRIFGVDTPESVRAENAQGELNVHNLWAVNGALDTIFQFFWAGLFVAVPLAAALWRPAREVLGRYLPVAPPVIAGFLILNYLLAQTGERVFDDEDLYTSKYPLVHSITELKEAGVGIVLGIAAFLVLRRTSDEPLLGRPPDRGEREPVEARPERGPIRVGRRAAGRR
ncbi:MAG TPA: hypothetical protein VGW75_15300 [Solirubrobacteraceae bacterium]|jgi:hypothetical protein|nr:hypothetical protein [Solirubrobacteraceae bacterium]